MYVRSTLRRMVWKKWLPPMASASPSPPVATTVSSGRAAFSPVATERPRPWAEWKP
jgi:hypothetical protein